MAAPRTKSDGFGLGQLLAALFVVIILVLAGILLFHRRTAAPAATANKSGTTAIESTKQSGSYAKLAPANVPSKTAECQQKINFTNNGVAQPIKCPNGELNKLAWNSLAALEPKVMTLGYAATPSQVQAALCADVHANVSNPIEAASYQISALYYGWHFASNPSAVITGGTCRNHDD
ncbi:MAG: hypothetical protein ACREGA_04790 [Candidatus Saccharimonadales bacterium]